MRMPHHRKGIMAALVLVSSAAFLAMPCNLCAQGTLDSSQAEKMAEIMCRQLPNLTTTADAVVEIHDPGEGAQGPQLDPVVWDDVYDALVGLGEYSVPCLVAEMTDVRWMPDPRMEPLTGAPLVGDVAYMILNDKGVPDFIPFLAHKKPDQLRMDDYFIWTANGDNRQRLQQAVRDWVLEHPNCCAAPWIVRNSRSAKASFRMTPRALLAAKKAFARLQLGMTPTQVIKIAGRPDAEQHAGREQPSSATGEELHLLNVGSSNRNEDMAYIYFTERWTSDIARRDPLRDRYLILYFTPKGKLTRIFSNVEEIPPVFPASEQLWQKVIWGESPEDKVQPAAN